MPFLAIISLPIIFAAGMSLMDTADGAFMSHAYGWAFSNPIRKIYYNITVTSLSVTVALVIGTIEILQVMAAKFSLSGSFWTFLDEPRLRQHRLRRRRASASPPGRALDNLWKARRIEDLWGDMIGPS